MSANTERIGKLKERIPELKTRLGQAWTTMGEVEELAAAVTVEEPPPLPPEPAPGYRVIDTASDWVDTASNVISVNTYALLSERPKT